MIMGCLVLVGNFNTIASVARLIWKFASDKGLPFHQHFTYVSLVQLTSRTID
jgi:hypothetical protein